VGWSGRIGVRFHRFKPRAGGAAATADGRVFRTTRGKPLQESSYGRLWARSRLRAFDAAQADSALAKRPYDLRHAAVSTWLNAGVPPTEVAARAGHSVAVLLRVYAKCLDGSGHVANRLIETALTPSDQH
jgi:integrase